MPMDWIQKKSCIMFGLTRSNCIDLGIHNEMEFLENLTTFNRRHQVINEKTKLLKMIQSSKTYLFKFVMALNNSTRQWDVYPAWWNPLKCVRRPHHCGHVGYKAAKPTTCDCHLTQKNMTKEKFQVMIFKKEALKLLIFESPMGIPTQLICFPKFFFSFLVHWRDIEDLVSLTIICLRCLFHL